MFVTEANGDLMVARVEVKFSKVVSACKAVVEVIDARNGEIVLLSDLIQGAIVDTHAHSSVFLFDKQYRGAKGASGRADMTRGEVFFDLFLCFLQFSGCLSVEATGGNLVIGDEVNGVMDAIGRGWLVWERFGESSWELFEHSVT